MLSFACAAWARRRTRSSGWSSTEQRSARESACRDPRDLQPADKPEKLTLDRERYAHWVKGARPSDRSDTVRDCATSGTAGRRSSRRSRRAAARRRAGRPVGRAAPVVGRLVEEAAPVEPEPRRSHRRREPPRRARAAHRPRARRPARRGARRRDGAPRRDAGRGVHGGRRPRPDDRPAGPDGAGALRTLAAVAAEQRRTPGAGRVPRRPAPAGMTAGVGRPHHWWGASRGRMGLRGHVVVNPRDRLRRRAVPGRAGRLWLRRAGPNQSAVWSSTTVRGSTRAGRIVRFDGVATIETPRRWAEANCVRSRRRDWGRCPTARSRTATWSVARCGTVGGAEVGTVARVDGDIARRAAWSSQRRAGASAGAAGRQPSAWRSTWRAGAS